MTKPPSTHECPRPGCDAQVRRSMLACPRDWFALPTNLRNRVWAAYRGPGPGSPEHTAVIVEAIRWWRDNP